MRKAIIAGNWKMNKTMAETKAMITELAPLVKDANCDVVLCVPFTDIQTAKRAARGTNIKIGAENVHWAEKGAFTGEISAEMLKELKVDYVIIGHSERRQYFGETEAERVCRLTEKVLERQIVEGLKGFKSKDFDKIVIAYEPVWAIGTGKTATAEDANETIGFIRKVLAKKFHRSIAEKTRIQYGGSMNVKNCKELMAKEEIDGGLIGGASLKAQDFACIVNYDK